MHCRAWRGREAPRLSRCVADQGRHRVLEAAELGGVLRRRAETHRRRLLLVELGQEVVRVARHVVTHGTVLHLQGQLAKLWLTRIAQQVHSVLLDVRAVRFVEDQAVVVESTPVARVHPD